MKLLGRSTARNAIHEFRVHDHRQRWANWHAQAGTPRHVVPELGARASPEIVGSYARLAAEHLAPYTDRLCPLREVEANGTNPSQGAKKIGAAQRDHFT